METVEWILLVARSQKLNFISTPEKFWYYLEEIMPRAGNISLCTLMEQPSRPKHKRLPFIGTTEVAVIDMTSAILDLHW